MQLSFIPLALPAEQDLLIRWLTSETWPFHVNSHPTQAMVLGWIQSGIFTGTNHQTFWIRADASDPIGLIRLYDLDDVDDGYPLFDLRIREAYRGQGIGHQAVQWLTRYLFETWPQLDRIVGTTREDNYAMQRVFQACGYVKEGHFRKDWRSSKGQRYDALQYAILREDWETQTVTPVAWNDNHAMTWEIRPYQS